MTTKGTLDKINEDLNKKIKSLEPEIAYLAEEILYYVEKGESNSKIEDAIKNEINEIVKEKFGHDN